MARLIYSAIMSLDGYIADADGRFEWAAPDEEVHAFVNELERPVGTYLYGRRMYETMRYWETAHTLAGQPPVVARLRADLASRRQDRVLDHAPGHRTPPGPASSEDFDPDQVRKLKEAADRDLTVGGAHLAAQAIAAGLVDEYQLFVVPAVVGGGTRALPDQVRLNLTPGAGAQVRQRHRLPLLSTGVGPDPGSRVILVDAPRPYFLSHIDAPVMTALLNGRRARRHRQVPPARGRTPRAGRGRACRFGGARTRLR